MLLYNIRKEQYANALVASGVANRWNKNEEMVIYTGGSASLATLELVVHRSGIRIDQTYKLLIIEAKVGPKDITTIDLDQLPANWKSIQSYPELQALGSEWYQSQKTLLLKVPSAVLPRESNYVINTRHPDFSNKIKIKETELFIWDSRLL
ncbi:MAG: hypothetical protein BGO31_16210 [Bacteroidetes bacterium 43-16]|nr:MAG: hypothetical protein BGO31_16210 [Bacteroidetes bacterium 43-16]